jgi:hypothetical protein
MRGAWRRVWPVLKPILKWLFTAVILGMIGYYYWRDLNNPQLWQRSVQHPQWLAAAGLLYLIGLGFSALYWRSLLHHFGHTPSTAAILRAYYVGHLGKYVPGKAWALFLRASLIHSSGVPGGLATLTAFYEVLVTMASGLIVAAILFAVFPLAADVGLNLGPLQQLAAHAVIERNIPVVLALLLLMPVLTPLLPPVFNRVVHRVSLPFREKDTPAPAIPWSSLLEGLLLTACGWLLLGLSLAAVLFAGGDLALHESLLVVLGRLTAILGLAYVAGFLSLLPGAGLGSREFVLILFLTPELKQLLPADAVGAATQTAIILRLVWTTAELLLVSVVYWFHPKAKALVP